MNALYTTPASSSTSSVLIDLTPAQKQTRQPVRHKQPLKPDWLLIMVGALFLVALMIACLVGVS